METQSEFQTTPSQIKEFRSEHGISQRQLAAYLGVTPQAVEYWEGGKRKAPSLLKLALEGLRPKLIK